MEVQGPSEQEVRNIEPTEGAADAPAADVPGDEGNVASSGIGDQVLDILQDVERQFDRLKEVQDTHTRDLESIADRSAALDARERELTERLEACANRGEELERRQQEIDERKAALDSREGESRNLAERLESQDTLLRQRQEDLESARVELEERLAAITGEESSLSAQVQEAQHTIDELRREKEELGREKEDFGCANEQLGREKEELGQQKEELTGRVNERDDQIASQESKIQTLQERVGGFDEERAGLDTELESAREEARGLNEQRERLTSELDEQRQRVEQQQVTVKSAQQECELLRLKLEKAEGELQRGQGHLEELGKRSGEQEGRLESLSSELAESRRQAETLEAELKSQAELLAQRDQRIAEQSGQVGDLEEKLELAIGKLRKFSELMKEQGPKLEHGAIAVATVNQQKQQIERLTEELAAAKLSSQPEELARRDERISQLTDALRQARGQTGADTDVERLEQQNAEITRQNDELRLTLEKTQVEAAEFRRQLEERAGAAGSHDSDAARLALERETLNHRVQELEAELEIARTQGVVGPDGSAAPVAPAASEAELAHMQRRRARLRAIRARIRRAKDASSATEELRQRLVTRGQEFEAEQGRLDEVKQLLADTERTMIRRWSRPRALTITGWFIIMVALAAAGSWFGAGYLRPPRMVASVTILAAAGEDGQLSDAELEVWHKEHQRLLGDPALHVALAARCSDLQFVGYRSASAISGRLATDLTVDAAQPGRLTLSLVGDNPRDATRLLDLLATTLATEAAAGVTPMPSESIVLGERHERGRVTYATLGPIPVEDQRMHLAVPMFVGVLTIIVLVFMLIVRRLQKAGRIFGGVKHDAVAVIVP